jgi:pimeloyl-ACP methyl ester carboxylesterase
MKYYNKDPRGFFLEKYQGKKNGFKWTKTVKRGAFYHSIGKKSTPFRPVKNVLLNHSKFNPNKRLVCHHYQYKNSKEEMSDTAVLFIHGYAESWFKLHEMWYFRLFSRIFYSNVYALELPYHLNRQPDDSPFSGAYYLNGNPIRMVEAFRQSLQEIILLVDYLKNKHNRVILIGISLGGHLVALSSQFIDGIDIIAALASPFLFRIASRINIAPISSGTVSKLVGNGHTSWYRILYPCNIKYFACPDFTTNNNTAIIGGRYDRIVPLSAVQELASMLEKPLFTYQGGHISIFPWLNQILRQINSYFILNKKQ